MPAGCHWHYHAGGVLAGEFNRVIRLEQGPVVVREWQKTDAEALAPLANDRRVWIHMRDAFPHPYGIKDARRFIEQALARSPPSFFAIEESTRLAGGIGYVQHTDVERVGAEVGYWLGHECWGRGIATAALCAVSAQAFAAHEQLQRLYAVPFACNPASARVLEKAGYRCEGTLRQSAIKDGHLLDQWMYALLREEWQATRSPAKT